MGCRRVLNQFHFHAKTVIIVYGDLCKFGHKIGGPKFRDHVVVVLAEVEAEAHSRLYSSLIQLTPPRWPARFLPQLGVEGRKEALKLLAFLRFSEEKEGVNNFALLSDFGRPKE